MEPKYGYRACMECGADVPLKIQRDVGRKNFCSRQCRGKFYGRLRDTSSLVAAGNTPEANAKKGRPGSKNPNWLPAGARYVRYDGYVLVKTEDGSWVYEHRLIVGCPDDMIVHHKNGNTSDNHPDNLEIMTPEEHSRLHHSLGKDEWSRNHDACIVCGKTERPHSGRGICDRCVQRKEIRYSQQI